MARKLRVQYRGAIYPVMNRGDRREAIFKDDEDRVLFLFCFTEPPGSGMKQAETNWS
jgi:putative transposase